MTLLVPPRGLKKNTNIYTCICHLGGFRKRKWG